MISENILTAYTAKKNVTTPAKVSAVIITFNEEAIIAHTLSKLWWCDEVVIIDSGSTDKTVAICRQYGCNVYERAFRGFGEQKEYGVSKAKNDWILCIDADEILTDSLIEELDAELYKKPIVYAGFAVMRNLVFMDHIFKYGKESDSYIVRLFNKQCGNWDGALVHEKVTLNGPVRRLQHKILHYSYVDYSQFIKKIDLYTTLSARKMAHKKKAKNKMILALALPFNFFKCYIIERNFLNGYHGFVWAVFHSFYHFVKYLKLAALKK